MAPLTAVNTGEIAILRAATYRIGAASTHALPAVVASVVPSLSQCKRLLAQPQATRQKDGEAGLTVHRLNTQINSLLQGRTHQERWAAAALIKAYIETGGWEVLSKSASHWVAGLTSNLRKPGPSSAKKTFVITITRIFTLTWGNPSLTREITTPALPGFITACIGLLDGSSSVLSLLVTTFNTFIHLAPRHPTIFRSFIDKINPITSALSRSTTHPHALQSLASRLAVILHQCRPKDTASISWSDDLRRTIDAAHSRLDSMLDIVQEQRPSTSVEVVKKHDSTARVDDIFVIAADVRSLLSHCTTLVSSTSSLPISIRLGTIFDLVSRLSAVAGCLALSTSHTIHFKPDVAREEQHALLAVLPALHVTLLQFVHALVCMHQSTVVPILHALIDQVTWIFRAERLHPEVRVAVYDVMSAILDIAGPSLCKGTVAPLLTVIKACCNDLLEGEQQGSLSKSDHDTKAAQVNADSITRKASNAITAQPARNLASTSASCLLPVLLAKLPSKCVSDAIRIQMDRTALLTKNKTALVASVLNPPALKPGQKAAASLLPFLAREYPDDPEVEALLRPRMPILQTTGRRKHQAEDDGESSDGEVESLHPDNELEMFDAPSAPDPIDSSESSKKRSAAEISYDCKRPRTNEPLQPEPVLPSKDLRSNRPEKTIPAFDTVTAAIPIVHDYAPSKDVIAASHTEPRASTVQASAASQVEDDEDFVMPELDLREDSDDDDDDDDNE